MMKTIIIPADLSNPYDNSLNTALLFEKSRPVDFILSFTKDQEEEKVHSKFNEIKNAYSGKLNHSDSKITLKQEESFSESSCKDISPSGNDSLILLNCNKANSVDNIVKTIRACRQNYLVLPEEKFPEKIKKIVFPIHVLTKVRHKVTFTSVIAKMFDAEVQVVTLQTTNQKEILKRLNLYTLQVINHLKSYGIKAELETLEGKKVPEMILEHATSFGADLISVIPEEVSGPRFFSKGFLYEMIEKSKKPLMVIAPRKAKISGSFSASG